MTRDHWPKLDPGTQPVQAILSTPHGEPSVVFDASRTDRRTLAVYRMVFGQSRQEDLVTYLLANLPEQEIGPMVQQLRIDLAPPKVTARTLEPRS